MKILSRLAVAAAAVLGLSGAASAQTKQLTFAVQLSPDVPQVILALERGYWTELGLDIKTVPFATGRESFEALLGGQVDFAALAEFPATIGILRQQKFAVIADMTRYGALRVIASAKRLPLKSLAELEGKKIGTTLGTNAEFVTSVLMGEGGVRSQIVNVAPPDIVPALVRGDIDAAVMFPTNYGLARKALGEDYRDIITKKYTSHFLAATRPELLAERAGDVTAFLKGLARGDEAVRADPAAAQEAVVRAMKGAMLPEVLAGIWKDTDYRLTLDDSLITLIQQEAAWILEKGLVKAPAGASEKANIRSFLKPEPLKGVSAAAVTLSN